MILLTTFAVACSSHSFRFSLNVNLLPIRKTVKAKTWLDEVQSNANNWGWSTILEDPSKEEEPEEGNILAPPGASRPKKEVKDMTKKALIAHCNSLVKKVARKQLTI